MKLNGIFGTGSGKTGNAVFATSAGKQIVRTYQPKVTNPNTDAQIAQRAKFKLLSQLAAAMAPVIVIPKSGLVSARNRFVKKNIPLATYDDDKASIELVQIQLTDSSNAFPTLVVAPDQQNSKISAKLDDNVAGLFGKVRYMLFVKNDSKLLFVAQKVVDVTNSGEDFAPVEFLNLNPSQYVVYAYGMNPKNASASVGYYDYYAESGETTADLDTNLRISTYNYNFTATKAFEVVLP